MSVGAGAHATAQSGRCGRWRAALGRAAMPTLTPGWRAALLAAALAACLAAAAGQCADFAVDESPVAGAGTNCSCDFGYTGTGTVACTACTPGKAKATRGAAPCDPCSPGSASGAAQRACTPCPPGRFAAAAGAAQCQNCTAGQFSAAAATACADCAAGTYSEARVGFSGGCSNCSAGTASLVVAATSRTVCQNCSAGSASRAASSACTDCLAGTYSVEPRPTRCLSCARGKFSTATGTFTGSRIVGLAQVKVVAASSEEVCTWCAPGFYTAQEATSACAECVPGTYSLGRATVCTLCPLGTASAKRGAAAPNETVCIPCTPGSWAATGFSVCVKCTPGKYQNRTGATSASACQDCDAGRYSDAGQSRCSDCVMGRYSLGAASVCTNCTAGTASEAQGLEANSPTVCKDCAPGNFSLLGSPYCSRCRPGYISTAPRAGVCEGCKKGFHNPYFSVTECLECPINTFSNRTGLSSCYKCPPNLFSRSASTSIEDCKTAQIEVRPTDKDWGLIMQAAPAFANIFLRPGNYTGFCNLEVNAVKIEGVLGKENTIIDCEGKQRHFNIENTRNITLIGLTLKNGYSEDDDGGCIKLRSGVLTLVESDLINCRSGMSGGAIHISSRSLIDIRKANFITSFSNENGGCLTIKNSTVRARSATFTDAHAVQIGGAVYLEDISDLQVVRSKISGCSAMGGGAMAFKGVKITAQIGSVEFSNNAAHGQEDGYNSGGGAILVLDNTAVKLDSCIFVDNSANYSGGALRIDTESSMMADRSQFLRNTARLYGGCMRVGHMSSFSGDMNIFDLNWGYRGAGVIAFSSGSHGGMWCVVARRECACVRVCVCVRARARAAVSTCDHAIIAVILTHNWRPSTSNTVVSRRQVP